jgi:hypothetical protein
LLTKDEARRIAANVAKLPGLLHQTRLFGFHVPGRSQTPHAPFRGKKVRAQIGLGKAIVNSFFWARKSE